MSMLGKVEDLIRLVHPGSRLRRGLEVLQDCLTGRRPEVVNQVSALLPGENSRVSLDGDALYLLVQCYKPRTREQGRFEAHARHTDLQFLWSGRECIEVCDLRAQPNLPAYDDKGNVYFPIGDRAHTHLRLQAGEVAVLFPQDAHAPCLLLQGEGEELVRKIVVKVMDAHLTDAAEEAVSLQAGGMQGAAASSAALAAALAGTNIGGAR